MTRLDHTDMSSMSECQQTLFKIQESIYKLLEIFRKLIDDTVSIDKYNQMKAAFENDLRILEMKIENIKKSASQDKQREINLVVDKMQSLKAKLNDALQKLEAERTAHLETKIKLCVSEIDSGRIESAVGLFKELNDDGLLERIVKDAYHNNVDKSQNIIRFLRKLPNISQAGRGYKALFDEMQKNNHLNSPQIIELNYRLNEATAMKNYPKLDYAEKMVFKNLGDSLANPREQILNSWANRIQSDDFQQIIEFSKDHLDAVEMILDKLVKKAYASDQRHKENMLKFGRGLPSIGLLGIAYKSLFDELKSNHLLANSFTLKLAYRVKEAMEMPNYQNVKQYKKNIFENLKNSIPNGIRTVIWSGTLCLRNTAFNEYVYGESKNFVKDNRRKIMTWVPGDRVREGEWLIEPGNGDASFFRIKNIYYGEYLFASSQTYDDQRREVFTWTPGSSLIESDWVLEPQNDSASYFYIKNSHYKNEYLFASILKSSFFFGLMQNGDRRRVFTSREGGPMATGKWEITSC
jgi:exonuclease VII large subunit